MTAGDSGWQPPGFLKANITAKDELQVCQACKHVLITHFPADDNEVTEIAAALNVQFYPQNNAASDMFYLLGPSKGFSRRFINISHLKGLF